MQKEFEIEVSPSTLLDLNKGYIAQYTEQARSNLSEGWTDPLKLFITAKKGQELFSQLEKVIRPYAEQETRLGKGEVYKKYGCEVIEKETGVSYDFTACDDEEWSDLDAQIKALDAKKKDREKFLKTITKPIFDENGVQIKPPVKKGKIGLAVTIK